MIRWLLTLGVFYALSSPANAQNAASDPQALSLAAQAMSALAGGIPVKDVMLTGTAQWTLGSDAESVPVTLKATGTGGSRMDLALSTGTRSEVRILQNGLPQGYWSGRDGISHAFAQHNSWTDAVWFFPAFSSLAHVADRNYVFSYIGEEERHGVSVQHLRVWQAWHFNGKDVLNLPRLSAMDIYLDASSNLPVAIAFNVHPDNNILADIPAEIEFADYRPIGNGQGPFHIRRLLNGSPLADITVTEVSINSGTTDSSLGK